MRTSSSEPTAGSLGLEPTNIARKRSFQNMFRSWFLLLRSWCFSKLDKKLSEVAFATSQNLSLGMFPSHTCSLLSSAFALHPALLPQTSSERTCRRNSLFPQSHNSSCREVESSRPSADSLPAITLTRYLNFFIFLQADCQLPKLTIKSSQNGKVRDARCGGGPA